MNTPAKTIDVLILEELKNHDHGDGVTAGDMARTWGEDWTRCFEWLRKFSKMTLCYPKGFRYEKRNGRGAALPSLIYFGLGDEINSYLAKKSEKPNPGVS